MRCELLILVLVAIIIISMSACSSNKDGEATTSFDTPDSCFSSIVNAPFTSDRDKSDALLNKIISSIENQDEAALISLFAPNQISEQDITQQCAELFRFFSGNMISYHWNGQEEDSSKHNGEYYKDVTLSYDVFTKESQYWFAMKFCTDDTRDEGNVGIQSLYIVRFEETDSEYSYWDDVSWTPGITVSIA